MPRDDFVLSAAIRADQKSKEWLIFMMKVKPVKLGKTERMSFSRVDDVIEMPNLIEVQKNSYRWFLEEGLREVFHDIGTIEDYTGNLALSFVDYRLEETPNYSIKECKERDVTYSARL